MAIRLYPNTNDVATLERLAGVPAGTAAKVDAIKKQFDELRRVATVRNETNLRYQINDLESKEYDAISADPDAGLYDNFIVFGWGRHSAREIGEETDPVKVLAILGSRLPEGVTVEEVQGLHWC